MSIEKKSLIRTLKTTKKANIAKEDLGNTSSSKAMKSPSKLGPSPSKVGPSPSKVGPSPSKVGPSPRKFVG